MKKLIMLAVMFAVCNADNISMPISNSDKSQKTYNTIPTTQQKTSADIYYAQQYQSPGQHQVPQYQAILSTTSQQHGQIGPAGPTGYLQLLPRHQYYMAAHSQPTPTAIMIIAQPALVPHHLVYGPSAIQHLLNYFHSNPQAKYQFLHGNYPGAIQSAPASPFAQATQAIPQYQYVAAPTAAYPAHYTNYISVPVPHNPAAMYGHYQAQGMGTYATPVHALAQAPVQHTAHAPVHQYSLAQIAALAAQAQSHHSTTYLPGANSHTVASQQPIRQAPAIITGLENFSPEQQAQIKQQLSSQLGPLSTLASLGAGSGPSGVQYSHHQPSYGNNKILGNKVSESVEEKNDGPFMPFDPAYHTISNSDSNDMESSKS